jgi:uncharacterized protein YjbI with pentapeptide repeats
MSEQQTASACPHPGAVGKRWGDSISEERQAELQSYLDRWAAETEHGERVGPFDNHPDEFFGVPLTGADVSWLAEQSGRDGIGSVANLHLEGADLRGAHLERAGLREAHLEGANLSVAHLENSDFSYAHLERVTLSNAHLKGAYLSNAHLEDADLSDAHLERTYLFAAHLESAHLGGAHLERTHLGNAHLEGAYLSVAHLEGTRLSEAHLERADLSNAYLEGANLSQVVFDKSSRLNDATLTGASLDQVTFDNVNLTVVDWSLVDILGDEREARKRKKDDGKSKSRQERLADYKAAVRANRVLAVALQAQGLSEDAARFAYRAQLLQRRVSLLRFRIPQYLGSLFLDLISGYGYRPARSLIAYVLVILGFAAGYFALGGANGQVLSWNEAIVISMTAFHGRGFFQTTFQVGDPQAAVAAVEALIGLLIEIVLIATFTQRFFAR